MWGAPEVLNGDYLKVLCQNGVLLLWGGACYMICGLVYIVNLVIFRFLVQTQDLVITGNIFLFSNVYDGCSIKK